MDFYSATDDVQTNFDQMYQYLHDILNRFYPECEITVTTSDPTFITPAVKAMLRRKNRLMHAGRVDEAASIARRVRGIITRHNSVCLNNYDARRNVRETWSKVKEMTRGRRRVDVTADSVLTADALNRHYAAISTDPAYVPAKQKLTAAGSDDYFTEYDVFHMLDRLKPTARGLDGMPVWFLRLMAPIVAAPFAAPFNQSISIFSWCRPAAMEGRYYRTCP